LVETSSIVFQVDEPFNGQSSASLPAFTLRPPTRPSSPCLPPTTAHPPRLPFREIFCILVLAVLRPTPPVRSCLRNYSFLSPSAHTDSLTLNQSPFGIPKSFTLADPFEPPTGTQAIISVGLCRPMNPAARPEIHPVECLTFCLVFQRILSSGLAISGIVFPLLPPIHCRRTCSPQEEGGTFALRLIPSLLLNLYLQEWHRVEEQSCSKAANTCPCCFFGGQIAMKASSLVVCADLFEFIWSTSWMSPRLPGGRRARIQVVAPFFLSGAAFQAQRKIRFRLGFSHRRADGFGPGHGPPQNVFLPRYLVDLGPIGVPSRRVSLFSYGKACRRLGLIGALPSLRCTSSR